MSGGLRSGFGVLLLVHWRGRAVGQGRLVLSYAALATLAVLGLRPIWRWAVKSSRISLCRPGCCRQVSLPWPSLPVCWQSACWLMKNWRASGCCTRQPDAGQSAGDRGNAGRRIGRQPGGVVRQHNPWQSRCSVCVRAADAPLAEYSAALATRFAEWRSGLSANSGAFRVDASGLTLRALRADGKQ